MKKFLTLHRTKAKYTALLMFLMLAMSTSAFAVWTPPAAFTTATTTLADMIAFIIDWATELAITVLLGWLTIKFIKKGANKAT